jgi:hypothetical protein
MRQVDPELIKWISDETPVTLPNAILLRPVSCDLRSA